MSAANISRQITALRPTRLCSGLEENSSNTSIGPLLKLFIPIKRRFFPLELSGYLTLPTMQEREDHKAFMYILYTYKFMRFGSNCVIIC